MTRRLAPLTLAILALVVWAPPAGATTLTIRPELHCLADGSTWVRWTVTNPQAVPFTVTGGTPDWPLEIPAHGSISAVTVLPAGGHGPRTIYADIAGYWDTYPGDEFYSPDPSGRLYWSEGQQLTVEDTLCGSTAPTALTTTTAAPTTSLPPVSQPILQPKQESPTSATTATTGSSSTAPGTAPAAPTPPADTTPTAQPAPQLADTGSTLIGLAIGLTTLTIGALLTAAAKKAGR